MSEKSQKANMKALADLLAQELEYIGGPRECGPNGAKAEFLSKGRAFLSALGADLGFTSKKVSVNPAGIAVSGSVTLMGVWTDSAGLYLEISKPSYGSWVVLYRAISHMKDYTGGQNNFITREWLERADYRTLTERLQLFRKGANDLGGSAA